jgi:3-methyladenine DNA glycosylase AlkC
MEKVDEKERFFLKDELFNKKKVEYLAELVESAYPDFDNKKFVSLVVDEFSKLELKERIFWILEKLEEALPSDFEKAVKIILKALPPELDNEKVDNDFGDFIFSPFEYFVSKNGCEKKNLKTSFFALSEITKRFTVEGGVRFFINKYPEETFDFMKKMARSKNYHQRRLASEGLRPKLPWCIGIEFDYKKSFEILDLLCFDKTRYVLRSVANHLNDVSKINPDFVVEVLEGWKKKLEDQKTSSLEGGEFQYLV